MSARHTPGPWFGDGDPFEGGILIYKQDGPVDVGMAYAADDREIDETRANARLIAAAPDLLEALVKARNTLAGCGMANIAADICDVAIARATGEQP